MAETPRMEFPEVAGKSLLEVAVYPDLPEGSEVLLRFTDGTQLSINLMARHAIDARFSLEDTPDQPIFVRES